MIAGAIKALIQSLILYFQDRRKAKREAGSEYNETIDNPAVDNIDAPELGAPTTHSYSAPSLPTNERKQNANHPNSPAVATILCILLVGAGIIGGYFIRDITAKEEIESRYEAGFELGRRQGISEALEQTSNTYTEAFNKGSSTGYSSGWNNGYLLGFENGAYFAMDEIDAGRSFFLTDLDGLGITLGAENSLAENQP